MMFHKPSIAIDVPSEKVANASVPHIDVNNFRIDGVNPTHLDMMRGIQKSDIRVVVEPVLKIWKGQFKMRLDARLVKLSGDAPPPTQAVETIELDEDDIPDSAVGDKRPPVAASAEPPSKRKRTDDSAKPAAPVKDKLPELEF